MKHTNVLIALASAALIAACASAPERVDQLESARAEVQALAQDPLASEAASRELRAARNRLQQAESALEDGRPVEEVVHLSYLAERHAETGLARVAERRARQEVAQGEAERNRVLLEARTREAQRAAQEVEAARQEALAARAEAESMQQQLADLEAKQTKRGMVLTLSDVLFDTDASTLKPGAELAIDRLAEFLTQNPETRIVIEGHTDSRGPDEYNQDLSRRRAEAVANALTAKGISADRFEVLGRGESFPVAENTSAAGRQQNRRVEIVFSDAGGRFAQEGSTTQPALR